MAHRNRWFTWVYLLKMGGFSMANCECHNQMDPMSLDTTPSTFRNLRAFVAHPFSSLVDSMPMKHYYCTGLHENVAGNHAYQSKSMECADVSSFLWEMWPGVHELISHSPGYFDAATYVVISPYIPKNLRVHQVMNPPGLRKKKTAG